MPRQLWQWRATAATSPPRTRHGGGEVVCYAGAVARHCRQMTGSNILFLCNGADFCLQLPIALYRDAINVYVLLIGMSNLTIENDMY